jgi:hypothetical protein
MINQKKTSLLEERKRLKLNPCHSPSLNCGLQTRKARAAALKSGHQPLSPARKAVISLVLFAITGCSTGVSSSKTTNDLLPNSDFQSNSALTIRPQDQLPTTSKSATYPSTGPTDQGQPTPGTADTEFPFGNGDADNTINSDTSRSSDRPVNSVPSTPPTIATTAPLSYTPFACIARLVPTLDRMSSGKKALILRVSVTEGKPKGGWWRIYYGSEIISGGLTFDSSGNSESSTLTVNAGSTVYAEIFASSQFLSSSIACEAQTTVSP